jgi:hypothetical protein
MTAQRGTPSPRRAAAAMSRRASLLTLGGTALAATIPDWSLVEAKKKGKNARKRARKCKKNNRTDNDNANDQCEQQLAPCRDFVDDFCALFNPPGPPRDLCIARAIVCCEPIAQCDGEGFFECLLGRIQSI